MGQWTELPNINVPSVAAQILRRSSSRNIVSHIGLSETKDKSNLVSLPGANKMFIVAKQIELVKTEVKKGF